MPHHGDLSVAIPLVHKYFTLATYNNTILCVIITVYIGYKSPLSKGQPMSVALICWEVSTVAKGCQQDVR